MLLQRNTSLQKEVAQLTNDKERLEKELAEYVVDNGLWYIRKGRGLEDAKGALWSEGCGECGDGVRVYGLRGI